MTKKQITNELIRELDVLKTIDKPWAKDFIQGYHDGLIFAIDRLIDGCTLPYKTRDYTILEHKNKKTVFIRN